MGLATGFLMIATGNPRPQYPLLILHALVATGGVVVIARRQTDTGTTRIREKTTD